MDNLQPRAEAPAVSSQQAVEPPQAIEPQSQSQSQSTPAEAPKTAEPVEQVEPEILVNNRPDFEQMVQLDEDNEVLPEVEQQFEVKAPNPLSAQSAAPASRVSDIQVSEDWIAIYPQLPLQGMLKSICGQLSFRQREGDFLIFDIDRAASGVLSDKYQTKFCELLNEYLDKTLSLRIESEDNANESPTQREERLLQEALEMAEAELLRSEAASQLTDAFDARLVPGSVSLK